MSNTNRIGEGHLSTALSVPRIAALSGVALLAPGVLAQGVADGPVGTAILGTALAGVSAFAAWRAPEIDWRIPTGLYIGMTIALILQAVLDEALRGVSHNLLPFEIAFLWFFGGFPVGCGVLIGQWLRRYRVPRPTRHAG